MMIAIGIVAGMLFGVAAMAFAKKRKDTRKLREAERQANLLVSKARDQANNIERDAKRRADQAVQQVKNNEEREARRREQSMKDSEQRALQKERDLDKKIRDAEMQMKQAQDREKRLAETEDRIKHTETRLTEKVSEVTERLEKVSGMTPQEAKRELVETLESEARLDAAKIIMTIEQEAKEESEKRAKKIISMAISRYAGEYASERAVTVLPLPNDEMKGRVIGREGRNIRAIEAATGIDLIIDDTPEAIIISGFDPVRREIARRSLEMLIQDGRIHPARIEEMVEKVRGNVFKTIKEDGDKAMFDLGLTGVNPEIVRLIGSLKYRTSYTQNNYAHSIEVGFLCGMMASEIGINPRLARRAGVLHDLGKALDHSIEGSHAVIGADFAKKMGESQDVVHAIRAHHDDEKPATILAELVKAADALSGARPGARREMMESYTKRLTELETIGNSFDGVVKTFAIQAGREVRVLVESEKVTDEQALMLSRDIAKKIERELTYPGQIKVTVIRETRAVDHAR